MNDLKNFLISILENVNEIDENEIACDCIYCGRSKSGRPHLHINFSMNVFHCFRCDVSGTINKLLLDLKITGRISQKEYKEFLQNRENFILPNVNKNIKSLPIHNLNLNDIKFKGIEFLIENKNKYKKFYENVDNFLKKRLNIGIEEIPYKEINLDVNIKYQMIFFYSYRGFYKIGYRFNQEKNKWDKITYPTFKNQKPVFRDMYFLESKKINFSNKNLIVTEGIIDLLTLYFHYKVFQGEDFLALSSKNMKIDNFIRSLGKYYSNVYIVGDNDVPYKKYLRNFKEKNKLDFIKNNIYLLYPDKKYKDVNEEFTETGKIKLNIIKKIHFSEA